MTGVSVTKPGPRPGRPPFQPTDRDRQLVEQLAGLGLRHKDIATLIPGQRSGKGISVVTLHRHFRAELDRGMVQADVKVLRSLFEKAIGNGPSAVRAAIWWAKTRLGWTRSEGRATNGGVVFAPVGASPEEWVARRDRSSPRSGGAGERGSGGAPT